MLNIVLLTNKDNSKMKSNRTKEEQVIFGLTIENIVKEIIKKENRVTRNNISSSLDHILFLMTNAPLTDLNLIKREIADYKEGIIVFRDVLKRDIALYINIKEHERYIKTIKSDFNSFDELLEKLGLTYSLEIIPEEIVIESKKDLLPTIKRFQKHINEKHIEEGISIINIENTYIDFNVKIGIDTVIYPNTYIESKTTIGKECVIGPDVTIVKSEIDDRVTIKNSTVLESKIAMGTKVGPYAYIRPNSEIGSNVKVGDFVEIKNSKIGDRTKISHLAYVGDADLGRNINIGCGTVFVNYDGKNKFRSTIEDNVFIGCNSNIIAPVTLKNNSYIAAGTTITKEVPEKALAIGRVRQENKKNYRK